MPTLATAADAASPLMLLLLVAAAVCSSVSSATVVLAGGGNASTFPINAFQAWATYFCKVDGVVATDGACAPEPHSIGGFAWTQCGAMPCRRPGCANWTMGAFPHTDGRTGVVVNGGIPQRGNLSYHLELLRVQVERVFPAADAQGNGIIDFEDWDPSWGYLFSPTGKKIRAESIAYTAERHPSIAHDQKALEALAQREFEAAAMPFFVESLKVLQEARPGIRWGFYGIPHHLNGCDVERVDNVSGCAYASPTGGPRWRGYNDQLAPVVAASDALYPDEYILGGFTDGALRQQVQRELVRSVTEEAVRLVKAFSGNSSLGIRPELAYLQRGTKTIVHFIGPFYRNGGGRNDWSDADKTDAADTVANIWQPPFSTEVLVWGGVFTSPRMPAELANDTGLVLHEATGRANLCAARNCSGVAAGWCIAAPFGQFRVPSAALQPSCVCRPGYTGTRCEHNTR